ncbi:MAG: hypothetical protein KJ630_02070 [Proteobacteria bacterium]|nr:hypothetical protein [Pseudomonadota bacterium]
MQKKMVIGRIIAAVFFGNMATLPYLWFVYPEFLDYPFAVMLGEMTAFLAEGFLYYFLLEASWRISFFSSFVANASSIVMGLLVLPPLDM